MKTFLLIKSLLLLGTSLACTFNTYTDKSAWEAAVGGFTTEDFSNEPVTPAPVQSLAFASGIVATVTAGVAGSTNDLGVDSNGNLKLRLRPPGTGEVNEFSFSLPSATRGLGLDLYAINRDTAKTRAHLRVGGTLFDISHYMQQSSSSGLSGFLGIETSDPSCDFSSFDFTPFPTDGGGIDDFNVLSIQFASGGKNGAGMGDPHFKTWNGTWYDFHGECDLVFLSNLEFDSGKGMDIHLRTRIRRDYSYIERVALRIDDDVLEVAGWGDYLLNGISGATLDDNTIGGFPIVHTQVDEKHNLFEVAIGPHETITLGNFKDLVSVNVKGASDKHFGAARGLMGSFATGEMLARDGMTVMADNPNAFGQEWQKHSDEANLFKAVRAPQHPTQKCILPSFEAKTGRRLGEALAREAAEKACQHWGEQKELCVKDVMAMGDLEWAKFGAL